MAYPPLKYRTTDNARWGAGKGANLTPTEVDRNFWDVLEWLAGEISALPTPVGISNITVVDNVMDVYLTDGTHFGPFTIDLQSLRWVGEWAPSTAYAVNDVFNVTGSGVYIVLVAHTSAATFDPNAGPGYYDLMISAADTGTGAGNGVTYIVDDSLSAPPVSPSLNEFYLVKPTGTGAWAGHDNDIAYWDGAAWQFIEPQEGQLIWGLFDGELTLSHMKVRVGSTWELLGNYLKEAQGLERLSVGAGWDADATTRAYFTSDVVTCGDAYNYGGTGDQELHQHRYSQSYAVYHYFRNGSTKFARIGAPSGTSGLKIDVYDSVSTSWRNGITIQDSTGFVQLRSVVFSQLPAASATYQGCRCFVTDAAVNTFGATISAGGGSYKVPAWCDGTNWLVG